MHPRELWAEMSTKIQTFYWALVSAGTVHTVAAVNQHTRQLPTLAPSFSYKFKALQFREQEPRLPLWSSCVTWESNLRESTLDPSDFYKIFKGSLRRVSLI